MPETRGPGQFDPDLPEILSHGRPTPLLTHPDPALTRRSEPVGYLSAPEQRRLLADLVATLGASGCPALSAPQIGCLRRAFVMDCGSPSGGSAPLIVLDPELIVRSDEVQMQVEECLSLPGLKVEILRPQRILLGWYDLDGRHLEREFTGMAARLIQHEIDHLDGRLIVDYLE